MKVDRAVMDSKPYDWVGNPIKEKKVKRALWSVFSGDYERLEELFDLVKARHEYR